MTQDELKSTLSYDKASGNFKWIEQRRGTKGKEFAGSLHKALGYVFICIDQKRYLAHRLAWLYEHGEMPSCEIDHIDGNRANNGISNLRLATSGENQQNHRKPRVDNKHGFMGCSFDKRDGRWSASIRKGGKYHHLGRFATPEEAHQKYISAKREMHPFCTI